MHKSAQVTDYVVWSLQKDVISNPGQENLYSSIDTFVH